MVVDGGFNGLKNIKPKPDHIRTKSPGVMCAVYWCCCRVHVFEGRKNNACSYIFLFVYLGRSPGVCTLIAMVGKSMVGGLQSLGGHI